ASYPGRSWTGRGVALPSATSVGERPPDRRLRSSRRSRYNLRSVDRGRRQQVRIRRAGGANFRWCGQEWNHIAALLSAAAGLHYHKQARVLGAQTERRDDAGPVRVLLGGGAAPAALFLSRSVTAREHYDDHPLTIAMTADSSRTVKAARRRGRVVSGSNNRG